MKSSKSAYFILSSAVLFLMTLGCSQSPNQADDFSADQFDFIIGGESVNVTDAVASSTVAYVQVKETRASIRCSGTLISRNLVLTAAHCVRKRLELQGVHFGAHFDYKKPLHDDQWIKMELRLKHPQYNAGDEHRGKDSINDLVLIKLSKPAPNWAVPVKILADESILKVGDELIVAGFGVKDEEKPRMAQTLEKTKVSIHGFDRNLILADQSNGNGACFGDSGGPAYLQTNEGLVAVGAVRGSGFGAKNCRGYVEYTSLARYKDFIITAANELGAIPPEFTR